MLKELFDRIVDVAQEAKTPERPQFLKELESSDGREKPFVFKGEVVAHRTGAPPRDHFAATAEDFARIVHTFATADTAAVFVGDSMVTAVMDAERRHRCWLRLTPSAARVRLSKLPLTMDQRQALDFLRRDLFGTNFDKYAHAIRNVVFARAQEGRGQLERDRESLGRSVEAKVIGTDELPDTLEGTVPWYAPGVFPINLPVTIGIDARLQEERFDLWLPPDELSQCSLDAEVRLAGWLREELDDAVVVRGRETLAGLLPEGTF